MREFFGLIGYLRVKIAQPMKFDGAWVILAENLLLIQQLLAVCCSRQHAPRLSVLGRLLFGRWLLFLSTRRMLRAAVLLNSYALFLSPVAGEPAYCGDAAVEDPMNRRSQHK